MYAPKLNSFTTSYDKEKIAPALKKISQSIVQTPKIIREQERTIYGVGINDANYNDDDSD